MPVFGPAPRRGEAIGARIPWLLLAFLIITTYSVVYEYAFTLFIGPGPREQISNVAVDLVASRVFGFLVLVFSLFAKLSWSGAWIFMIWRTHFARYRSPVVPPKRIMQSDPGELVRVVRLGNPASNARFRRCNKPGCDNSVGYGDRTYHCTKLDRHYPLYDHYCYWLWVAVYLDTYKPYLCLCFWIVVDGIVCLVVSVYAATRARSGLAALHTVVAIFSGIIALWLASSVGYSQFRDLAFRNMSHPESHTSSWHMVRTIDSSRGQSVQFVTLSRTDEDREKGTNWTPWSLSPWENFRQCMGERAWTWPFFWMQPKRVKLYGRWPGGQSDLPLGELWRRFEREPFESDANWTDYQPMPAIAGQHRDRRAIARSSGFEAANMA